VCVCVCEREREREREREPCPRTARTGPACCMQLHETKPSQCKDLFLFPPFFIQFRTSSCMCIRMSSSFFSFPRLCNFDLSHILLLILSCKIYKAALSKFDQNLRGFPLVSGFCKELHSSCKSLFVYTY
jgi:hypothetical protein